MILYYGSALILGVLFILAPILNGRNALALGTFKASFFNYLSATLTALICLMLFSNLEYFKQLPTIPPHYFLGGVIGCFVILLLNYFTTKIKAFYIVILPFMGQMTLGIILDYMFIGNFEIKSILGLSIICFGLYLQSEKKEVKLITSEDKPTI
ncbi:DMT family transporter [Fusibacter ferrireducens]|uniref:DMT family transporter n=1 Tax=Fusibacter ferrireducens TaxID=2785058 RepID=A0ABR9ZY86_9FIRM|nr:DMT family transporter [Fusibacter ferrireducens]MBF4695414.1 DMT family transporter [Fusibacter ferrireducens]